MDLDENPMKVDGFSWKSKNRIFTKSTEGKFTEEIFFGVGLAPLALCEKIMGETNGATQSVQFSPKNC